MPSHQALRAVNVVSWSSCHRHAAAAMRWALLLAAISGGSVHRVAFCAMALPAAAPFHAALNFAGVFFARRVVSSVKTIQFAISVPVESANRATSALFERLAPTAFR